jgi:SAM-dependent methyltransferase
MSTPDLMRRTARNAARYVRQRQVEVLRRRVPAAGPLGTVDYCRCCGSGNLALQPVLWSGLIDEWGIAGHEVEYINRQQGLHCLDCHASLRSMALAVAIMRCYGYDGLFTVFVTKRSTRRLRILEINEAGQLTQYLSRLPGHVLGLYPEVDMLTLPYADRTFDLVVHSDTLEHVKRPVDGLAECRRVLQPGGVCAFTVPIIIDRLTSSPNGLPPSYHGFPDQEQFGFQVETEYGSDAWKHVVLGGFQECQIQVLEYPAAQALVGVRGA